MRTAQFETEAGKSPFQEWFDDLRDRAARVRILARLRQVESGNLGDCVSVGEGVVELRLHFGPGYRIYCGRSGEEWIILLCGGDKSSQVRDIQQAKSILG